MKYNLEKRTWEFAKNVRDYIKKLPKTISNFEYTKQLIRCASSVAANYIEANESISKKDFILRVKICRKEGEETILWLKLTESLDDDLNFKGKLIFEELELSKIFASILKKTKLNDIIKILSRCLYLEFRI